MPDELIEIKNKVLYKLPYNLITDKITNITKQTSIPEVVDVIDLILNNDNTEQNIVLNKLLRDKIKEINIFSIKEYSTLYIERKKSNKKLHEDIENAAKNKQLLEQELQNYDIHSKAEYILECGKPFEYIINTISKFHVGDETIAKALVLSVACQSITNTSGLQNKLSGRTGGGKTSICKSVAYLIPNEYLLYTGLTAKSLYYAEDLKPGTVVFSDDDEIDEGLAQTVKRSTSNYQEDTKLMTVIDGKSAHKTIPPRICWWFTSVSDVQSEQVLNRQFVFDVDESQHQDEAVHDKQKRRRMTDKAELYECEEVLVSREIFRILKNSVPFAVIIPFADRIVWEQDKSNRRNFDMFCDLIASHAALNFMQRNKMPNVNVIEATYNDFDAAVSLYATKIKNQNLKLNDKEIQLCKKIAELANEVEKDSDGNPITVEFSGVQYPILKRKDKMVRASDVENELKISQSQLSQILNGRKDCPDSGLLHKLKGMLKASIVNESLDDKSNRKVNRLYLSINNDINDKLVERKIYIQNRDFC